VRGLPVALLLLLGLPAAGATPVTLYAHVAGIMDFPMTTQAPADGFQADVDVGLATPTLTCVHPPVPVDSFPDYHTQHGYVSPRPVEYGLAGPGGAPGVRIHPDRGLAADVVLDRSAPMVLHWYWSQHAVANATSPRAPDMPVLPRVVVEAELRASDAVSANDTAYDTAPLIAHGRSAAATLAGPASSGVTVDQVGERTVYGFTVPMAIDAPVLPRATGFNLRVSTFLELPCDGHVMPDALELHTSPGHRPRLEFGAADWLHADGVRAFVVNGTDGGEGSSLVLQVPLVDAWGSYDVKGVDATWTPPGAAAKPMPMPPSATLADCFGGCAFRPLPFVFVADLGRHPAPGTYRMEARATAIGNASATAQATYVVAPRADAPSPSASMLVVGLVVAGLAVRRRGT